MNRLEPAWALLILVGCTPTPAPTAERGARIEESVAARPLAAILDEVTREAALALAPVTVGWPPSPPDEALVLAAREGQGAAIDELVRECGHDDDAAARAGACAALLEAARHAFGRGQPELARAYGLNIYLSGVPHAVRLDALDLHVSAGDPDDVRRRLELIETAQQDHWFQPALPAFERALADRGKK